MNINHVAAAGMLIGALGAGTASAQQAPDTGFYFGASVGRTAVDVDTAGITASGLTVQSTNDTDTGYKLYAGYQFHRNWAVEGGYYDFGNVSASGVVRGTVVPGSVSASSKGWGLAAVGILPVHQNVSLFGKLGAIWYDTSGTATAGAFRISASDNDSEWMGGVGVVYNFSRNFGLRAEAEWFGSDTALYSVGIQFKF